MPSRKSVRRVRCWFRPLRLEPLEPLVLPGFVAPLAFDAGTVPYSVAVGDFNGDGIPDLAVANYSSNDVSVLLGNGDGSFQGPRNFAAGISPRSVAVGDFNGDGIQDLAVANFVDPGTVSVLLGNGDGTFGSSTSYSVGSSPTSLVVADLNHDGAPDLAELPQFGPFLHYL